MQLDQSIAINDQGPATSTSESRVNWLTWLTGSTLFASLGYGFSYTTGLVYHQTYLSRFDVPPDLFKQSTAEYFVFAYAALLELIPSWLEVITGGYKPLALFFLLFFVGGGVGLLLAIFFNTTQGKRLQTTLQNNKTLYIAGGLFGIPAITLAALIFFLCLLIFFAILPAWIGSGGAEKAVARDKAKFSSTCSSQVKNVRCMDLIDDEKLIATGYVLQASDRYIALLTATGVKILPLKERALQLHTPHTSGRD